MTLNKATLSEQIYAILRSDILTQKIKLGEKLTLKTLKERFGVSSTPIREALTRLTEDGLVEYFTNVGVKVISLSREDLIELFEFMGDLDGLAIRHAAASPEREALLNSLKISLEKAAGIEQIPEAELTPSMIAEWTEYSDRFHLIFYDFCSNNRLKEAAGKLRSQLTIFSNAYESDPAIQRKIDQIHQQIYLSCLEDDFEKAQELMKKHLQESLQYALQQNL